MGFKYSREAQAYTIYMIFGSYFKKAVCISDIREKQLRLDWVEQKKDNQIKQEERCEHYIDQRMIPNLPEEIFNDMVEVQFIDNDKSILVVFKGFDWEITMWAAEEDRFINYYYEFENLNK